jgi:uncharacterized protein
VPDELTAPFWNAAREGRLVIQRCKECRAWQHPPGPICRSCYSTDLEFAELSGRGVLYSFTVTHHAVVPGFESEVPYIVAVAELEEQRGLRFLANLKDADAGEVQIGLPVQVTFDPAGDGTRLPRLRLRR